MVPIRFGFLCFIVCFWAKHTFAGPDEKSIFALGTCPPGTFLSNLGTCQPCPDGSYSKQNDTKKCTRCDDCRGRHTFIAQACNATSNTICGCEDGYFYGELLICVRCQLCKRGRGVVKNCTATSDTVCGSCEKGKTFSSAKDLKECTQCDQCEKGYIVKTKCSRRSNTVCMSERDQNASRLRPLKTTLRLITAGKSDTPPTSSTTNKKSDSVVATKGEPTTVSTIPPNNVTELKYVLLGVGLFVLLTAVVFFGIRYRNHRRRRRLRRRHSAAAKTRDRADAISESSLSTTDGIAQENRGSLVPLMVAQKDKPLRSTSCTLVQQLSQHLNPHGRWKELAGALGFTLLEINNFALDPVTATEKVLTAWGHGEGATLLALHNILTGMKWKREAKIVATYM